LTQKRSNFTCDNPAANDGSQIVIASHSTVLAFACWASSHCADASRVVVQRNRPLCGGEPGGKRQHRRPCKLPRHCGIRSPHAYFPKHAAASTGTRYGRTLLQGDCSADGFVILNELQRADRQRDTRGPHHRWTQGHGLTEAALRLTARVSPGVQTLPETRCWRTLAQYLPM